MVLTKADVSATVAEQLITVVRPSRPETAAPSSCQCAGCCHCIPIEEVEPQPQPLAARAHLRVRLHPVVGLRPGTLDDAVHGQPRLQGHRPRRRPGVLLARVLSCPLLVRRSSRAGRLDVLRLCMAVGTLSSFLLAFAGCASAASPQRLAAMMGARALAGFAGACIPVAQAAVSDIVRDPAQRANALAVVQASSSLGIVVGLPCRSSTCSLAPFSASPLAPSSSPSLRLMASSLRSACSLCAGGRSWWTHMRSPTRQWSRGMRWRRSRACSSSGA